MSMQQVWRMLYSFVWLYLLEVGSTTLVCFFRERNTKSPSYSSHATSYVWLDLCEGILVLVWIPVRHASKNIFLDLFDADSISKKVVGYNLVSLCQANNKVFRIYKESWKKFKIDYFLATHISPHAHTKFYVVLIPSSVSSYIPTRRDDSSPRTTS